MSQSSTHSFIWALVDKRTKAIVRTFVGSRAEARSMKNRHLKIVKYVPAGTA